MFAPDGAYMLAANSALAVSWAIVRLALMASKRRASQATSAGGAYA